MVVRRVMTRWEVEFNQSLFLRIRTGRIAYLMNNFGSEFVSFENCTRQRIREVEVLDT